MGRTLTRLEVRDLRRAGIVVPVGARVVASVAPHRGVLYRPLGTGWASQGVILEKRVLA
jgi:hypothetical protein